MQVEEFIIDNYNISNTFGIMSRKLSVNW